MFLNNGELNGEKRTLTCRFSYIYNLILTFCNVYLCVLLRLVKYYCHILVKISLNPLFCISQDGISKKTSHAAVPLRPVVEEQQTISLTAADA